MTTTASSEPEAPEGGEEAPRLRQYFPETLLLAREPVAWGPTAEVLTAENYVRQGVTTLIEGPDGSSRRFSSG